MARPPTRSASSAARSQVRLAMRMSVTPLVASERTMPSPMSPAPMTRIERPSSEPRRSAAMATAAVDTEATWRPMPVSVRARLPTSRAWRNSRFSCDPAACSVWARSHATRTWPRISASPITAESRPAATENRCDAASAPSCT